MKLFHRPIRTVTLISLVAALTGCGIGNDQDAGSLTEFNVVPTEMGLKGPDADTCGAGYAGRVYVFGGNGPYVVKNSGAGSLDGSVPAFVLVSRTTLARSGDFFEVTLLGCMENVPVVIVDQQGRQATVSMSSTVGE